PGLYPPTVKPELMNTALDYLKTRAFSFGQIRDALHIPKVASIPDDFRMPDVSGDKKSEQQLTTAMYLEGMKQSEQLIEVMEDRTGGVNFTSEMYRAFLAHPQNVNIRAGAGVSGGGLLGAATGLSPIAGISVSGELPTQPFLDAAGNLVLSTDQLRLIGAQVRFVSSYLYAMSGKTAREDEL